jgi:hypothetical protein
MEPGDLQKLIRKRPVLIRMYVGREMFVAKVEFMMVGEYNAGVLDNDYGAIRYRDFFNQRYIVIPIAPLPKKYRRPKAS